MNDAWRDLISRASYEYECVIIGGASGKATPRGEAALLPFAALCPLFGSLSETCRFGPGGGPRASVATSGWDAPQPIGAPGANFEARRGRAEAERLDAAANKKFATSRGKTAEP